MIYTKLAFNTMPFNRSFLEWEDYFIGFGGNQLGWIKQLSKFDYQEKKHVDLFYNVSSNFNDCKYFYHTRDNIIKKLDIYSFHITIVSGHLFPKHKWLNFICYHNLLSKQYEIHSLQGNKTFDFKYQHPIVTKFIDSGVLLYQNSEKENNWIKCLDPNGGVEKWKKEFPWQFVRLETYKSLIILDYLAYDKIRTDNGYEGERDWYHPSRFTIVLNGDTGEEVWTNPNSYHFLDFDNGVILTGKVNQISSNGKIESLTVIELNINNGAILTEREVTPTIEDGFQCHFVDNEGIYYISYNGSFGKINRANGSLLWEFDLIDDEGEKRKLSDWLLLGNGNLVLQATPNHPNGDFTCIFNPKENMELSRVKNGIRIL